MLIVSALVAACMACASKQQPQLTGSCVGDPKYEQVKITVEHDNANEPSDINIPSPVTIYLNPDSTMPSHKGQVCWIIESTKLGGPITKIYKALYVKSHDGTALFDSWTTKKKLPGDSLEIASGLPNQKHSGWKYDLKSGGVDVDPVIIVIDDSH